jgi:hypothetical protein
MCMSPLRHVSPPPLPYPSFPVQFTRDTFRPTADKVKLSTYVSEKDLRTHMRKARRHSNVDEEPHDIPDDRVQVGGVAGCYPLLALRENDSQPS